ncbi:MAG: bifunctional lysine ketoglutarate reductase /saccharopine dehydrogenase family protein [Bacteroidales bacterium]|jgi:saccharopine dehydrogenase (NAD+, L-lysine-forming)|nr:bifunctional lysine ketoglutarate reductase /saccharopine dehydrogenase family protein [Bacteroidales bacterium]
MKIKKTIAIRHEDKYKMERRAALAPRHVEILVEQGIDVLVESSAKRIFSDEEYSKAGAKVTKDISDASLIFGVKEMPLDYFEENKTYVFFSHTIKGQEYNMPLLQNMIDHKINLIEYEKIANEKGQRLIFFGHFAGLAGMINSLWSYGQRLEKLGFSNCFSSLKQSHKYSSLAEATAAIKSVGKFLKSKGLNPEVGPLIIGITGYGNVSKGAQEIADLLPSEEISPTELLQKSKENSFKLDRVYKVVFKEADLSTTIDENANFELQDYYNHPEKYKNQFEQYVPHISILMNCMYWDDRYPRIVTKDFLEKLYENEHRLKVIGDITCDPNGSIEATHIGATILDPVFVYNPKTRKPKKGFESEGLLIMSVEILPAELPRESSEAFGNILVNYVKQLAEADYTVSFDDLIIAPEFKRALILHNGIFTPDFEYMANFIK